MIATNKFQLTVIFPESNLTGESPPVITKTGGLLRAGGDEVTIIKVSRQGVRRPFLLLDMPSYT